MQRVRLELDQRTFDALVEAAVHERRPVPWQAEMILRRALGIQRGNPLTDQDPPSPEEARQ